MMTMDESIYSRQIPVLGEDGMDRMLQCDVLVCGMRGLGAEVAKDIVLAGVRSILVQDAGDVNLSDLSSQFLLGASDIGLSRAVVSCGRLVELNDQVLVSYCTDHLSEDLLSKFQVVVLTDSSLTEQLWVGEFCHKNNIKFIVADTRGLFGQVFCDFGETFEVSDLDGEQYNYNLVTSITKGNPGVVRCLEGHRHGYTSGDYVIFSGVQGMIEINDCDPIQIEATGPDTFTISDTSMFSEYTQGGIVTKVKTTRTLAFKSMSDSLAVPVFVDADCTDSERPRQLHIAFQALHQYERDYHRLPRSSNQEDADDFLAIAEQVSVSSGRPLDTLDVRLLRLFAGQARGDISPIQAVIGGLAAQEVIKACCRKFTPISQWFYFDAVECLPDNYVEMLTEDLCKPRNTRYDGQIAVFGHQFQDKLAELKYFLVGAGAVGCEILKNWAMMGVSAGPTGRVTVADMDKVHITNIHRQLLYRLGDVGKGKSSTAVDAVGRMNPALNIEAHDKRVCVDTEHIYHHEFYSQLDGVANALDNIETRGYMDERCVYYRKPLLETGTLGLKGHVQVIIPHVTESYRTSQDPPTGPHTDLSSMRWFPVSSEHLIHWASHQFHSVFDEGAKEAKQYINEPDYIEKLLNREHYRSMESVETIKRFLVDEIPACFSDCVSWARNMFQQTYNNEITQLLFRFPPDLKTSSGDLFWTGYRRCPHPLVFDINNGRHIDYIVAASNLFAAMYGMDENHDRDDITRAVLTVKVLDFEPVTAENTTLTENNDEYKELERLIKEIPEADQMKQLTIQATELEVDNDRNHHMEYIMAAANLRAETYDLPNVTTYKCKLVAGGILPAIVTTSSIVAGLACLELYKLVQGVRELSCYRNSFMNLSLPLFIQSEPRAPPVNKYHNKEWTLWDRFEIEGDLTLQQFIDYFKDEHKLEVMLLSHKVHILYAFFMSSAKKEERLKLSLRELVEQRTKKKIGRHVRGLVFDICCDDEQEEDIDVPSVKYILP